MHDGSGFAFDSTVGDLARGTDTATARWVAKVLELPTGGLALDGPAWPWLPTLVLVGLTLPGAGLAVAFLRRRATPVPVDAR